MLLLGAVAIANLVTGKTVHEGGCKAEGVQGKAVPKSFRQYRFCVPTLYTSAQKVELVSDNLPVLLGITAQQVQERPELVFSASGMAPDDPAGCSSWMDIKGTVPGKLWWGNDPKK